MAIIQFSPIRSGSTLVYNYLLELKKNPIKDHRYHNNSNNYYVITIRHPYNAIISSILRTDDKSINTETIKTHINEYLNNGGNDIINNYFNKSNCCVLKYENFYINHNIILNQFEIFFNERYSDELRDKLKTNLDINNVKKQIINQGFTKFNEFNKKTHLHGKHISDFNGATDYNKLLNEEELILLKKNKKLSIIIDRYYR